MSNGNGHSWSKFCWRDWSADKALHPCSLASKGFWIEMLCIMHEGTPVGHLTLGGKPATIRQMAANAHCSEKEAKKHLAELEEAGVFSRTEDGTIYSRRMVKDAELSEAGRAWGKTGGNPLLKRNKGDPPPTGGVNPPLNPTDNPADNPPLNPGLNGGLKPEVNPKNIDTDSDLESKKESKGLEINSGSFSEARARVSTDDHAEARAVHAAWRARQNVVVEAEEPIKTSDKIVVLNHVGKVKRAMASTVNRAQGRRAERTPDQQDRELKHGPPELVPEIIPPQRICEGVRSRAEQYAQILGISLDEANEQLGITQTIEGCVA